LHENTPETLVSVVWYTGRGHKIEKSNLTQFEKGGTYNNSQGQLTEMMDINRSTISKIENGKFSISVDYLVRLSIFFRFWVKNNWKKISTEALK
jgi:transcriptional regulator with XRE-family HTH domain